MRAERTSTGSLTAAGAVAYPTAMQTLTREGQLIADELRDLFESFDAAAWRDEVGAAARQRVASLSSRLREAVTAQVEPPAAALRQALQDLEATLERATPEADHDGAAQAAWLRFREQVQPAHDALAAALKRMSAAERPPRPANHARMVFHVCFGLTAATMTYLLPSRAWLVGVPLVFAIFAWTSELTRTRSERVNAALMRLFGRVAHAHEWHRVNSATWFTTGLVLIALLFPKAACALAVLTLGFGDPCAALVGRRLGRTRLRTGRSVEGTLAFFLVSFVAAMVTLRLMHPYGWLDAASLAVTAAAVGSLTELYSERLDDNFSIPVAVAGTVSLVMWALGLS